MDGQLLLLIARPFHPIGAILPKVVGVLYCGSYGFTILNVFHNCIPSKCFSL
jgi:hypothetical protein